MHSNIYGCKLDSRLNYNILGVNKWQIKSPPILLDLLWLRNPDDQTCPIQLQHVYNLGKPVKMILHQFASLISRLIFSGSPDQTSVYQGTLVHNIITFHFGYILNLE